MAAPLKQMCTLTPLWKSFTEMNDDQLARYSRHLLLPEIDTRGQEKLLAARILVVGLGGLGSPAAIYLAASGIGTLVLCDGDEVDVSNLQRQILHATSDLGRPKTASALTHLRALNPGVRVLSLARKLEGVELQREVERADAVLDCSDNFPTRFALNEACATAQRPLISGSAIRSRRLKCGRGPAKLPRVGFFAISTIFSLSARGEYSMPSVKLRENEPFEVALRRFKRTCEKAGVLTETRRREFYEKPTTVRKRKAAAAVKRHLKKMQRDRVARVRLY